MYYSCLRLSKCYLCLQFLHSQLSDLIRPPTQSGFNKKLEDHKESIYQSKKDKPLGKSRKDLTRHVPDDFDKTNVFGITTEYGYILSYKFWFKNFIYLKLHLMN